MDSPGLAIPYGEGSRLGPSALLSRMGLLGCRHGAGQDGEAQMARPLGLGRHHDMGRADRPSMPKWYSGTASGTCAAETGD
jgi:hypothetical protein